MLIRAIAVLTLFAMLPLASAGIGESIDVLPTPEGIPCTGDSGGSGGYWSSSSNNSSYYHSYETYWDNGQCASRTDAARGNVTANGHEVAAARASNEGSNNDSYSQYDSYDSWSSSNNDSYSYSTSSRHDGSYQSASEGGAIATASTFAGDATILDKCSGATRYQYADDGSSSYRSTDNGSSTRSSSWSSSYSYTKSDDCVQSATLATGVTTLAAGRDTGCTNTTDGGSFEGDSAWGWRSYEWNDSHGRCADQAFVGAGSVGASAGQRSACDTYGFRSPAGADANNTTESYEDSRCTAQNGAWGPNGLAVYTIDQQESSTSCGGSCGKHQGIGIEHDFTGPIVVFLPVNVPSVTLPALP